MRQRQNPYNALIYFSQGAYIELMAGTGMPAAKKLLRLLGKGKFADRMDGWENSPEGLCGAAIENDKANLNEEVRFLAGHGQACFGVNSRRNDTEGRKLRFKCAFPDEIQIPFMMTYFNIDPKPKNFTHPNGAVRVKSVEFGTQAKLLPLISHLCGDAALVLYEGQGIRNLQIEYSDKSCKKF
ncbi:MAG: VOC family protein [Oscillospiraceae bacterium]